MFLNLLSNLRTVLEHFAFMFTPLCKSLAFHGVAVCITTVVFVRYVPLQFLSCKRDVSYNGKFRIVGGGNQL